MLPSFRAFKSCLYHSVLYYLGTFFGCNFYPSPSFGEAYSDRQLTTNFELWVEKFWVPTCFHVRIPKQCLSVCPYPEKRNRHSFVNIIPTLVIDTSMERSSRVLQHGNPKIRFFFFQKSSKFQFWLVFLLVLKSWNHLSFVNISTTLVIDTSMERSSRLLYHEKPKNWFSNKKKKKTCLTECFCCDVL